MTPISLPVYFQGRPTGLTSPSKAGAAVSVWAWLLRGEGPTIPEGVKLYILCDGDTPAPSPERLRKNTRLHNGRFEVTVGLPDRRRRARP